MSYPRTGNSQADQVVRWLEKNGPAKVGVIAAALGWTTTSVSNAIGRASIAGEVRSLVRGRHGVWSVIPLAERVVAAPVPPVEPEVAAVLALPPVAAKQRKKPWKGQVATRREPPVFRELGPHDALKLGIAFRPTGRAPRTLAGG